MTLDALIVSHTIVTIVLPGTYLIYKIGLVRGLRVLGMLYGTLAAIAVTVWWVALALARLGV